MSHAPPRRMTALVVRHHLLAVLATVAALALPVSVALPAPPASAAPACEGVSVRVERPGSVTAGCAAGDPDTGLEALAGAGYDYTFVTGQSGFVCTIDGYPDPCNDAPADAYWSYWHADAGATSWTYATRGAGTRNPPAGSHEAWVFGDGSRPPSAPPPPPASDDEPSSEPEAPDDGTTDGSTDGSTGGTTDGSSGGTTDGSGGGTSSGPTGATSSGSTGGSSGGSSSDASDSRDTTERTTGSQEGSGDRGAPGGDASSDGATPSEADTGSDEASSSDRDAVEASADDGPDASGTDGTGEPDDPDGLAETRDRTELTADEDVRATDGSDQPEALGDTVIVDAPGGGRSAAGALAGGLVVVALGAAGVLRARRRDRDLGAGT